MAVTRPCPYCAETIKSEAITCRFCKHSVTVTLIFKGTQAPLSDKELHQIALKFVASKKSPLAYQDFKTLFAQKSGTLAENISYADAQQLQQLAASNRLHVAMQDNRSTSTMATPAPANLSERSSFAIQLQGYHLLLLISIIMGGWYLLQNSRTASLSSAKDSSTSTVGREATTPAPVNVETDGTEKPANIQEALIRATVMIADGNTVGSGFFVHPSGYLITNVHVIEKMQSPQIVLESGERFPGVFVRAEKALDIAVLKINGRQNLPYLAIGDATATKRGETVWTVGSPHGLSFTLTKGIVSYVGRNVNGIAYLQTDAAINGGNSGGPMINEKGQVIGINTFIIKDAEGLGFALPVNYLYMSSRALLQDIVSTVYPNDIMQQWYGYTNQGDTMVANFDRPKPAPSNPAVNNQPDNQPQLSTETLKRLLQESQDLDNTFSQLQAKLNKEIAEISNTKQTLEQKYFNNNQSLSITQETQLGGKLKEINLDLTNRQITLYEKADAYFKAKETNIKATLPYAESAQLQTQLQNLLIDVKTQIDKNQQSLASKRQELATLKTQAY